MGFETTEVVVGRTLSAWWGEECLRSGESAGIAPVVGVMRGREAVAAMHEMLVELSHRSGQAGAMDALEVFLHAPCARAKTPYLLLVGLRERVRPDRATADDVDGAVLIYEYRMMGRGTGVFATDDMAGGRTVIAPAAIRTEIAEIACRALVENGATVALVSLTGDADEMELSTPKSGALCRVATRRRLLPRYLPLADSYEATLATLGKHTRRNLRYYRRIAETKLGVEFVPTVVMGRTEFMEMNRTSTNPAEADMAAWRYESLLGVERPVFCGLRAADGRWLSLLGGRRRTGVVDVDWQLNLAGMARYSLSTVMRAFLLEYEISQGTRQLVFEGGTPHPMRHSFVSVDVVDVIAERRSAAAWLLRRFAPWIFPERNFLAQALCDVRSDWIER
jgi:hypothetical protein